MRLTDEERARADEERAHLRAWLRREDIALANGSVPRRIAYGRWFTAFQRANDRLPRLNFRQARGVMLRLVTNEGDTLAWRGANAPAEATRRLPLRFAQAKG